MVSRAWRRVRTDWGALSKRDLAGEDAVRLILDSTVVRVRLARPEGHQHVAADRGFGDQKLFAFLGELGFGYVIRLRGNIRVADEDGVCKAAADWVGRGGRARKLRHTRVTAQGWQVGAVVCVHAKE